jgi:hypothetical protein
MVTVPAHFLPSHNVVWNRTHCKVSQTDLRQKIHCLCRAQAKDKELAAKTARDFLFAPRRRRDRQMIVRIAAHKATRGRAELRLNCVMAVPMLGFSVQGAFTSLIR